MRGRVGRGSGGSREDINIAISVWYEGVDYKNDPRVVFSTMKAIVRISSLLSYHAFVPFPSFPTLLVPLPLPPFALPLGLCK